jgi:hypothetical protein
MKVEDVIKTIRNGAHELILDSPLHADHAVGFSEFLWALSSSTSVRRIDHHGSLDVHLSQCQKEQVIETFGSMKKLEEISFSYGVDISPKALSSTMRRLKTLRVLNIGIGSQFSRTTNADMLLLASAFQSHPYLERFSWNLRQDFDPVIAQALVTCPRLQHLSLVESGLSSISNGIRYLTASSSLRSVDLRTSSSWEPISHLLDDSTQCKGAIRLKKIAVTHIPRSSDQQLSLEDVKAIAKYIPSNTTLEVLQIVVKGAFNDEMGVILANAIKNNRGTLRFVSIRSVSRSSSFSSSLENCLQERAYRALYDSLQENHNLVLTINTSTCEERSQKLADAKSNVSMLSKLNSFGRGRLRSEIATRADWLQVLSKINQDFSSDQAAEDDEMDGVTMALSCIYSIVRMNPLSLLS